MTYWWSRDPTRNFQGDSVRALSIAGRSIVWFSTKWFFQSVWRKNRFFNIDGDRDIQTLNQWVLKEKPAKWIENSPNKFSRTNQIHSRLWIKIKTESHIWFLLIQTDWSTPNSRRRRKFGIYSVHPFAKTTRNTNRRHHDVFFYLWWYKLFCIFKGFKRGSIDQGPNGTRDRYCPRNHSSRQHPIKE
jgi:hypothetical protein